MRLPTLLASLTAHTLSARPWDRLHEVLQDPSPISRIRDNDTIIVYQTRPLVVAPEPVDRAPGEPAESDAPGDFRAATGPDGETKVQQLSFSRSPPPPPRARSLLHSFHPGFVRAARVWAGVGVGLSGRRLCGRRVPVCRWQGGGIERLTVLVFHQRRVTDSMGVTELSLSGTIPLVLTCARRTTALGLRVLLWRHIQHFVGVRKGEDEEELMRSLPVRVPSSRLHPYSFLCRLRLVLQS